METIPTGSLGLDIALGVGGLPKGRVIEIYGPESSGKTTLALHSSPRHRRRAASAPSSMPSTRSILSMPRKLGVNVDDLLISQPDTGEQALEICDTLVRSGAIDVIVIDSVAALMPKAEIEGEMGEMQPGLQARLMSQALRKLTGLDQPCPMRMVIFINQIRDEDRRDVRQPRDHDRRQGAEVLARCGSKFVASERSRIGDEAVGSQTRVKVVKNKVAPPFKQASSTSCLARAFRRGRAPRSRGEGRLVEKTGAWFSYGASGSARGARTRGAFLKDNPESPTRSRRRSGRMRA